MRRAVAPPSRRPRRGSACAPRACGWPPPRPWSTSTAGWMPRASSRSSWSALCTSTSVSSRSSVASGSRRPRAPAAAGAPCPTPSSRCWAPSWRSRSSRRRSSSPACTMRARDSRSSTQLPAQLGLQPLVLERELRSGTSGLEQLRLVQQHRIMDDRCEIVARRSVTARSAPLREHDRLARPRLPMCAARAATAPARGSDRRRARASAAPDAPGTRPLEVDDEVADRAPRPFRRQRDRSRAVSAAAELARWSAPTTEAGRAENLSVTRQ